ncbi:hypothetical protein VNO80_11840 [Phaseolus coccineus]|uniref:Uncharacterized protein n=1 Tax=Phaseolus coccineus TaxID=3886 RepID=A0AAN9NAX9_PHACN
MEEEQRHEVETKEYENGFGMRGFLVLYNSNIVCLDCRNFFGDVRVLYVERDMRQRVINELDFGYHTAMDLRKVKLLLHEVS